MDAFSRHAIRVAVAEICQIIGWTSIQTSPLEILTDILQEYIIGLGKIAARYALLFGQCEPNLHHVALAFKDMGISISELEEYVTYVESSSVLDVPKYPIPKESHLNFLKPGSREVVTRPFHIHEHLPPMHPHLEDQEYLINKSPLTVEVSTSDNLSPLSSPKGIFKKPGDPISSDPRRGRQLLDDETRPVREISSVMMTTSGFLSPAREGKLPEARTQPVEFSNPPSPEVQISQPEQQQQLQQQQQTIEVKTEKKKKSKPVEVPFKKPDKENKSKEEPPPEQKDSEDESKGKKLLTTKETSKLKAFKTGALKIQQSSPSPSPSPPPQKKAKLSPNSSQPSNSKQNKIRSPKNDKRAISPLIKDVTQSSLKEVPSDVDIKLPSEPDKQKLNIFKKITKLKEDNEFKIASEHREINSFLLESSSGSLKKTSGDSSTKDDYDDTDAQIDVENSSPLTTIDSVPESPIIEKNIEVAKISEPKKKKKDKQKEKKDLGDKESSQKSKYLVEESMVKEKSSIDPDTFPEEDNPPAFSIIPSLINPTPGLIPPWNNNPLYPLITPSINSSTSSGSSFITTKKQEISTSSGQLDVISSSSSSVQALTTTSVTSFTEKDDLLSTKKKKRDKKLKDKIKKKKEKKLKNKIKDKSERKKLKLEKKEKAKLKSKKEKKEKKKEKELFASRTFEQSHIAEDVLNTLTPWGSDSLSTKRIKMEEKDESVIQVPKITFKLGPASPKDITEPLCPRKIVIKPIVKKEEDDLNPGTSTTLDAPKPSTLKVKSHKSGKTSHHNKNETDKTPSFLFPQILPIKQEPFPFVPKWEADPNQVWICPACSRPDDGSPMIACDMCDLWFHWTCVGIVEAIESDWYCKKCNSKREDGQSEKKKKHRKKKN